MEDFGMRHIPQAIDVERSILGSLLTGTAFDLVFLTEVDFYDARHREIFKTIKLLHDSGSNIDLITVSDKLKSHEDYIIDLTSETAYDMHINDYCKIVKEKAIRRNVIQKSTEAINDAYDDIELNVVLDKIAQIDNDDTSQKRTYTPKEILKRDELKPKAQKLFLGYSDLDHGIYGDSLCKGQVELTIADSGHGKTQYALFKAESLLRRGYKVAWFQLEGYDSETAKHMINNEIKETDNMFITDSLYDIEDIKRESRRLNREHDLDFIVFDYVQNVECSQNISRTEKVEYISKQITKMAKELNVVCNPLSQITISYNTRFGWKQEPSYGDVRWSQQLKQDASIITSVFRPSRIESLCVSEEHVLDWNDKQVPYNSVYIKQAKVRHGVQEWRRFHMIHTDKGIKPYTDENYPF